MLCSNSLEIALFVCVCVCYSEVVDGKKMRNSKRKRGAGGKTTIGKAISTSEHSDMMEEEEEEEESLSRQGGGGGRGLVARSKVKRESLWSRMVSCPESEEYLQWKEAILTAARARISQETGQ